MADCKLKIEKCKLPAAEIRLCQPHRFQNREDEKQNEEDGDSKSRVDPRIQGDRRRASLRQFAIFIFQFAIRDSLRHGVPFVVRILTTVSTLS